MNSFQDLLIELLKSGNYAALLIFFLIGAIWFLSKALKQKDEFILKQYENLQNGVNKLEEELSDEHKAIMQSLEELGDKINELEKAVIEAKLAVSTMEKGKGGK